MEITDIEYLYLTRCIGDTLLKDLSSTEYGILRKMKSQLGKDPIKAFDVMEDVMSNGFNRESLNESIYNYCISLKNVEECTILMSEEGNPKTFKIIDRIYGCPNAIIRLPKLYEDCCEEWLTSKVVTQDQYDYLKLMGIKNLKWQYEGLCSEYETVGSIEVIETPSIPSINTAIILGAVGFATMFLKSS